MEWFKVRCLANIRFSWIMLSEDLIVKKENKLYKYKNFFSSLSLKSSYNFIVDANYRNDMAIKWRYAETKFSLGSENSDKTFYVIRTAYAQGVYSFILDVMNHILYAEKMNYIPVIDECNIHNFLVDPSLIGKENVWDRYFEQPAGYTLQDIKRCKNIIVCDALEAPYREFHWQTYKFSADSKKWHALFSKNFILRQDVRRYIAEQREKVFGNKQGRILGVAIRRIIQKLIESDDPIAEGHPVEPPLDIIIKIVKEEKLRGNFQYVFCTSDDAEAINIMKQEFMDAVLYVERERVDAFKEGNIVRGFANLSNKEKEFLTYILEMNLLSECDMLITGRTGGGIAADIMNNGQYEKVCVLEEKEYKAEAKKKLAYQDGYVVAIPIKKYGKNKPER